MMYHVNQRCRFLSWTETMNRCYWCILGLHVHIFLSFYSLALKLRRLLVWSMFYKFAEWNGQTRKVTWLMSLRKPHPKSKTAEMALFHVWHFEPFQRLTLNLTGAVHCSMFYTLTKFPGRAINITWLIVYGKPHLRRLHPVFYPLGEVPPDFTPRSPDFVVQLAFDLKWLHSKFGFEPLKPGGATLENVFFSPFCLCFEMPLFHFHIFLSFYSLALKLRRLLD